MDNPTFILINKQIIELMAEYRKILTNVMQHECMLEKSNVLKDVGTLECWNVRITKQINNGLNSRINNHINS